MRAFVFVPGVCALAFACAGSAGRAEAQRGQGRIVCQVRENGQPGSGTMVVRRGSEEVATGSCGVPLAVSPGDYTVVVRLDGALDQPEQSRSVHVEPRGSETVAVDFPTGTLTVEVRAEGHRAAAMVTIFRNGKRIGTLASGVAGHLSAGSYDLVVRYRNQERRFSGVVIHPGGSQTVDAAF